MPGLGQGPGDPLVSRIFWIPRSSRGMTEKGIIQRSYKMMSIVKPRLLRRGEFTIDTLNFLSLKWNNN
jgi:hypothetical protein